MIPYRNNQSIQTTIGQLNFFKWVLENNIIDYIETHYQEIETDMNERNSISKKRMSEEERAELTIVGENGKTRNKREELSVSACKCIKKELVKIVVKFN
jgi:hypothetical protein